MRVFIVCLTLGLFFTDGYSHANYTGRSGAPSRQTCAASCHGGGSGTVQISGFPAAYVPGQSYLLTIERLSGSSISNFNASCRIGTGTNNAGVITAGTSTSTYNVSGETNGVHFSSNNRTSGTFNWQAPATGTGTVRLYCGALQGSYSGQNTTLVLISSEAASNLPDPASNPLPTDLATNLGEPIILSWTAGAGAESHDVYFGASNPPALVTNQTGTTWDPPDALAPTTTYFWRIDERNASGVTPGPVWRFTMGTPPAAPQHLNVYYSAAGARLRWHGITGATEYRVYRAPTPDVQVIPSNLITTTMDSTYVDASAPMATGFYTVTAYQP